VPASPAVEIVPLGGLGEFGMNLMVVRSGDDALIVDCGLMFPSAEHLGVELILPDLSALDRLGTLHGVLVTHGHEDHLGAVPWLLTHHSLPVFATPYAASILRPRLKGRLPGLVDPLVELNPSGGPCRIGPFAVETFPVSHSIPHCLMAAIETPEGWIVHSGDFKLDPEPLDGVTTDLEALRTFAERGVLALLSDSTNAEVPGFTPPERRVGPELESRIREAPGRVFVTTFASNVYRIRQVAEAAVRAGRKLAVVGRSFERHVELGLKYGLLPLPAGLRVPVDAVGALPASEVVVLVTGSQGEPNSALARLALDRHRDLSLEPGDRLIHSARRIPGNEKAIQRVFNHVVTRGGTLVDARSGLLHVSGHASREEQALLLRTLRPKHFVPIHGEATQLAAHEDLALSCGLPRDRVHRLRSGDRLRFDGGRATLGEPVPVGHVFIDGTTDTLAWDALRDRRRVADDGLVVAVVSVGGDRRRRPDPEVLLRGFAHEDADGPLLDEARERLLELTADFSREEREDEGVLRGRVQQELKRFFRRRTGKRPLIVPVVVEF